MNLNEPTNELSFITRGEPKRDQHLEHFVCYYLFHPLLRNVCQSRGNLPAYSLLRNAPLASRCLCYDYSVIIFLKPVNWPKDSSLVRALRDTIS
jgi:hypothetical protein